MKKIIQIGAASLQRTFTRIATFAWLLLALLGFSTPSSAETVRLYFDPSIPQIVFAAGDIKAALENQSYTVQTNNLSALTNDGSGKRIILALTNDSSALSILSAQGGASVPGLGTQAYALRTTTTNAYLSYWVVGGDATGAMYGGLQIAENISFNGFSGNYTNQESPFLLYRGMKLNLPLDKRIPTYVGGWSSHSAQLAISNVWDMTFWTKLIDQQTRNRYNFLSVWVHHPFPALVKTPDYPNASLPNIQLYDGTFLTSLTYTQRVAFWRQVMQYAHNRGMKFYFFDWNIYVDYASTQYPALTTSASNTSTINYLYESMQALLATYPELDGFGITTGDGMSGTAAANTTWSWNAYGQAVYDYLSTNSSRQFNLIHRGVGTDPQTCFSTYAPLMTLTNATFNTSAKYAMAHMYSATAPTWTGDINTCYTLNQKTFITVRNDDYFYINWGDPKFVRDFMTGIPHKDPTVRGMYIGSDGYNPSRTYFCKDASQNGQLEVERRWYMEMLWGRISYNTNISDTVFQNMLAQRYPAVSSSNLFNAWSLASRSLPKVTELIMKDWNLDFHWYPEGCWSDPGRGTGFRTISSATGAAGGFAGQDVASGSALCNIANSAAGTCGGKKSSYQLADEMEADAANALALINPLLAGTNAELNVAINNVKQMAYLSDYYAHKIRGATYNLAGQTANARTEMGKAYCSWTSYSQSMFNAYNGDAFRNLSISPDWKFADAAVLKEYTDLGGVGTPDCGTAFALTVQSSAFGSISLAPDGGSYPKDTAVQVTAKGNLGFGFSSWGGALAGSTNNPAVIVMDTNKSISANYVPVPTYTLTTTSTNGSITLNPPGGVYNAGTVVTVTANPNTGYLFNSWSGDLGGSVNPTTLTMNGNRSVTANFAVAPIYTITATAGANGAISPSGNVPVTQSENQSFTMLPNGGYEVDVVTVDGASQGPISSYTFTNVTAGHQISVTFKVAADVTLLGSWVQGATHARESGNNRALVVMLYGEGSGNISASSVTYGGQAMTKVVEKAFLNSAYSYSGAFVLNEAGVAAASSGTIAVTWSTAPSAGSDVTSAFYSGVNQSTLTGASASNGLVGLTITTTALANNAGDMVLVGGTAGTAGTYTINNGFTRGIPETTASFGDITSAYKLGTGTNETPSLTMSGSMRQTIVAFVLKKSGAAPVQYTLTTNAVNGTITLNPTGGVYTGGTVVTVTANPNSGYTFSGWSGDLSGSVSPTNITMNANKSVTANFSVQSISFLPPILQGGQLRLEWVGGGTLQTATGVLGPWNDVSGAVSPYLNPATNSAQFFRVKQ